MIITFFDLEVNSSGKVADYGALKVKAVKGKSRDISTYHKRNADDFFKFIKKSEYLIGHNIIAHDLKFINEPLSKSKRSYKYIDTLILSAILFTGNPYHRLCKDDKLYYEENNNPLNDSIKAKDLFYSEVEQFNNFETDLKDIIFWLAHNYRGVQAFFEYVNYEVHSNDIHRLIKKRFKDNICDNCDLENIIQNYKIELLFVLMLLESITAKGQNETKPIMPSWVSRTFPQVEVVLQKLRGTECLSGCKYCTENVSAVNGLKKIFWI